MRRDSGEGGTSRELPVAITMTFQQDLRTLLGTPPDVAVTVLEAAGADFVGANCSLGPEGIYEAAKIMAAAATVDLLFQPNAGLPKLVDGKTIYPASPEELGDWAGKFIGLGVKLVGSCCGSTPAHTKAIADAVRGAASSCPPHLRGRVARSAGWALNGILRVLA